jgi:hypothetical protein
MPKMKTPERNVNRRRKAVLGKESAAITQITNVQQDMARGRSNAHARIIRNPCLSVRGSSPL